MVICNFWWEAWWFYLSVFVFVAGIIVYFFKIRFSIYERQKKHLEDRVQHRTNLLQQINIDLEEKHEEINQQQDELRQANENMRARQDEILQQKEELIFSSEILEKTNEALILSEEKQKKINAELEKYRHHLEDMVKERTKELMDAKRKAEESDKLKSSFLANMSHEIRTPLNVIVGFSELLNSPNLAEAKRAFYAEQIETSSDSLLILIDDILDLSRIEAGVITLDFTDIDIDMFLHEMRDRYYFKNKNKNVKIVLNTNQLPNNLIINTDQNRMKQILINLLDNALKFTAIGSVEFGYVIEKDNQSPSNSHCFYVKDTGIGIEKHKQKYIFDRFRKVEGDKTKLFRGAGLGLSICKKLVELLGGKIWVESVYNEGTTFYFEIVSKGINKVQATNKAVIPSIKDENNWQGKVILIAEDENTNLIYLESVLKETNATLLLAHDGKQAVEIFESAPKIDLILMDIKMPVMNGLDATRAIKSKENPNKPIPIVAQTAYAAETDRKACFAAGCCDFISKPVKARLLFDIISKHIGQTT